MYIAAATVAGWNLVSRFESERPFVSVCLVDSTRCSGMRFEAQVDCTACCVIELFFFFFNTTVCGSFSRFFATFFVRFKFFVVSVDIYFCDFLFKFSDDC